jgi:hypothetical protein
MLLLTNVVTDRDLAGHVPNIARRGDAVVVATHVMAVWRWRIAGLAIWLLVVRACHGYLVGVCFSIHMNVSVP